VTGRNLIAVTDHWLLNRVSARQSWMLDRALPTLGDQANYGRLWFVLAGAMSATGDRRARQAALRGALSMLIASASANLLIKRLFRRTRPENT
jgi:hypothetical protein